MPAELTKGIKAIERASGLVEALGGSATDGQIDAVKAKLQQSLGDAQRALLAAQKTDASSGGRLHELPLACLLNPKAEAGEALLWLCSKCLENGRRSHLKFRTNILGHGWTFASWTCGRCRSELLTEWCHAPRSELERDD